MSTKQHPSQRMPTVGSKAASKRPQQEGTNAEVWEKLPDVLRKQLTLQVAQLLHKVASQPVEKGMRNE